MDTLLAVSVVSASVSNVVIALYFLWRGRDEDDARKAVLHISLVIIIGLLAKVVP